MNALKELDGGSKQALKIRDDKGKFTSLEKIDNEIKNIDSQLGESTDMKMHNIEVKPPQKPKKIAVMGFAGTSRNLAPFNNPEWEIWGLNALFKEIPWASNFTRWFEFHPYKDILSLEAGGGPEYEKFLKGLKIPLYTEVQYKELPTSVRYPLEKICDTFHIGTQELRSTVANEHITYTNIQNAYLTNSISMMIALAIYEMLYENSGTEEIGVWGVDMAHSTEYGFQRSSCEFYIGICEGLRLAGKIKTWTLPKQSSLLKTKYIYGYQADAENAFKVALKARKQQLVNSRNTYLQQVQTAHDAEQQFLGAMQENEHMSMNWGS